MAADVAAFAFLEGAMQVLLVRRRYEPYESYWALPGGGLHPDETLEQAAVRELREETGVSDVFMEQLATFSEQDRDPRGRVISCCYLALVDGGRVSLRPGSDAREAAWRPLEELLAEIDGGPVLAFDHDRILQYARRRLAYKLEYQNVAWSMLPERFTMTELSSRITSAASRWGGASWPRPASVPPAAGRPPSTASPSVSPGSWPRAPVTGAPRDALPGARAADRPLPADHGRLLPGPGHCLGPCRLRAVRPRAAP